MTDDLSRRPFADYPIRTSTPTRWSDNDMYGHMNNAKYYELFDTAINAWIAEQVGRDFPRMTVIGVVAESACRFHAETAFPGAVTVGMRVQRLGRTSVTYNLALFEGDKPSDEDEPVATGHWVHVYVDRAEKVSTPIPQHLRTALEALA